MSLEISDASERIKIGLLGDWWLLLYSEMLKKLFQLKFSRLFLKKFLSC